MLEDDAVLLGLAAALVVAGLSCGEDALAHGHGHLLLVVDAVGVGAGEGLDAQVGGLVAQAAGGEGLVGGGGGVDGARGQGGEEVGFGEEALEGEVLGAEGAFVFVFWVGGGLVCWGGGGGGCVGGWGAGGLSAARIPRLVHT